VLATDPAQVVARRESRLTRTDDDCVDRFHLLEGTLAGMCRNIKTLHNFDPPATSEEIQAAALQYVRKVSGSTKPSKANEEVFMRAVDEIAHITEHLLEDLVTTAAPRDREVEAARARARAEKRFGRAA
jgi:hypothetical protein